MQKLSIIMRYIGCKTKILSEIESLLKSKKLDKRGFVFFDAFCGTSSVSFQFKHCYKIIANDNLYCAYVIAQAKLNLSEKAFTSLGFDPFQYFNNCKISKSYSGFVSQNFSPQKSERMYFSVENAQKIDFIRTTIEQWYNDKKITRIEKFYLIASLLESLSKVANVAGVYGAYLKIWDPRAIKPMSFIPIDNFPMVSNIAEVYNDDILTIIRKVSGDIIYIDPPYTRNQYSVQYHLLETIARYDNPILSGKTGARDMSMLHSDFSKDGKAHIAFEQLIANANFKHIVVSYSSDGIMSKDFIESVLKRYGKKETFEFKSINNKRYKNIISADKTDFCEYLFYIEKITEPIYASPLNFIGGKADLIAFLRNNMPPNIATFYDLFGGGFNVGINIDSKKIVYNDINFKVRELIEFIATCDLADFYKYIKKSIKKFGLEKANKEAYLKLRAKYNASPINERDVRDLFTLIMYGFQQQIRFNGNYDYNNPVGQAGFNNKILEKLVSFARVAKQKNIEYYSADYSTFIDNINLNDFVYLDPPYLITLGSYNDGKRGFKGWNMQEEKRLLRFLDDLNARHIRFMLSNVLYHKDKENKILKNWIESNNFNLIPVNVRARGRDEIIVTNYIL